MHRLPWSSTTRSSRTALPLGALLTLPLTLLVGTGCGSKGSDRSAAEGAPAVAKARQPIVLSSCKASALAPVGSFKPTVAQVVEAAEALPGTCLPAARIADALSACAAQVGPMTEVMVEAPGYSACQHSVNTLQVGKRNFIAIDAFIGEAEKFHGRFFVVELIGGRAEVYYYGFVGDVDCEKGDGASANLKSDWETLPPEAKKFICPG